MPMRPCPICNQPAELAKTNPYRPFCCERCKLVDLSKWLDGDYRVPTQERPPQHHEGDEH